MGSIPGSAKLKKGAIVQVGLTSAPRSVIFQYNPEQLTRTLTARNVKPDSGNAENAFAIQGAPEHSVSMTITLEAADMLEKSNPTAQEHGIYPQLAALELLIYPKSEQVMAQVAMLATGAIEISPPSAPMTVLVWGDNRIVPIQLQSFTIQENMYDNNLNPLSVTVDLNLDILSYTDLNFSQAGFHMSYMNQIKLESLAVQGGYNYKLQVSV